MSKMRHRPLPRRTADLMSSSAGKWWSQPGSNRRPQACKASALPTELWPHDRLKSEGAFHFVHLIGLRDARCAIVVLDHPADGLRVTMVGREGVEPSTSRLSGVRSNHLSYRPPVPR